MGIIEKNKLNHKVQMHVHHSTMLGVSSTINGNLNQKIYLMILSSIHKVNNKIIFHHLNSFCIHHHHQTSFLYLKNNLEAMEHKLRSMFF